MGTIIRLLSLLPRNVIAPVVFLVGGWYGGAKHGAPEILLNTVDTAITQGSEMLAQGSEILGNFVPGTDNEAS